MVHITECKCNTLLWMYYTATELPSHQVMYDTTHRPWHRLPPTLPICPVGHAEKKNQLAQHHFLVAKTFNRYAKTPVTKLITTCHLDNNMTEDTPWFLFIEWTTFLMGPVSSQSQNMLFAMEITLTTNVLFYVCSQQGDVRPMEITFSGKTLHTDHCQLMFAWLQQTWHKNVLNIVIPKSYWLQSRAQQMPPRRSRMALNSAASSALRLLTNSRVAKLGASPWKTKKGHKS